MRADKWEPVFRVNPLLANNLASMAMTDLVPLFAFTYRSGLVFGSRTVKLILRAQFQTPDPMVVSLKVAVVIVAVFRAKTRHK
jgi:hypothetical protein